MYNLLLAVNNNIKVNYEKNIINCFNFNLFKWL